MKFAHGFVLFLSLLAQTGSEFLKKNEHSRALAVELSSKPPLPAKPTFGPEAYVLGVIAPGSFIMGLAAVVLLRYYERRYPSNDLEVVDREPENLDEDVYGAGVATLVRDSYSL